MKTLQKYRCWSFALGAAVAAGLAYGDAAPPFGGIKSQPAPSANTTSPQSADTAMKRLDALRANLQTALDALNHAAPNSPGGFVERAKAGVSDALALVAAGTDYVKAHPEANLLSPDQLIAMPHFMSPPGAAITGQTRVTGPYPTLPTAINALDSGLINFVNGAPDKTKPIHTNFGAGVLIGDLGGYRDKIIRSVAGTWYWLVNDLLDVVQRGQTPVPPMASAAPGKLGAISGVVVDPDGDPAAHVLIGLTDWAGQTARGNPNQEYSPGMPVALSDDQGAFTITDLPPGAYIVTGCLMGTRSSWGMQGSIQPVTVSEGATTPLDKPLSLH